MTRSLLPGIALFAAGLLLGVAGLLVVQTQSDWARPNEASSSARHTTPDELIAAPAAPGENDAPVRALARLEPAGGVISINGTPGDRLEKINVRMGDHVKTGDLLATLESHALRKTERDLAASQLHEAANRQQAELRYADAMLAEADLADKQAALHRLDLAAQQEKIDGLAAAARSAQADLDRLKLIKDSTGDSIVSGQQFDHQKLACKKAEKELAAAKAQLEKLNESVRLAEAEAGAKRQTAEANRARVESTAQLASLEKQVTLAKQRLELTELRAPCDGQILKTFANAGDTLTQSPVLQMADTSRFVASAEIYENDVRRIKPQAQVHISGDALPEPLLGRLEVLGQMVARNTVVRLEPTDASDIRVIEARIPIDRVADDTQAAPLNDPDGKLTEGKAYRYQITFAGGRGGGQSLPSSPIGPIVPSGDQNAIRLSRLPELPAGYTSRRIYRTAADGSTFGLLREQTGQDARTGDYLDTVKDDALKNISPPRPLINLQVDATIDALPPPGKHTP